MQCPRCDGHSLSAQTLSGIEVDRCPSCNGVWLDRGEGEMVTRPGELPAAVIEEIQALADGAAAPDQSAPLPCPRCEATMRRERYAESAVEIDRCRCGVWLDDGELEKIASYRARCMEQLARRGAEAAGEGDAGLDLSFSAASLERAFARIYFDVGGDPG